MLQYFFSLMSVPANKIDLFSNIVLRVTCLMYTQGLIQFSKCAILSRLFQLFDDARETDSPAKDNLPAVVCCLLEAYWK